MSGSNDSLALYTNVGTLILHLDLIQGATQDYTDLTLGEDMCSVNE